MDIHYSEKRPAQKFCSLLPASRVELAAILDPEFKQVPLKSMAK